MEVGDRLNLNIMKFPGVLTGVTFIILLLFGASSICIMLIPTVFVMFVHSVSVIKYKRMYINTLSKLFFDYTAFLLTHLCGTKVTIYSDDPDILKDNRCSMIIANHRCRIDWMYVG